MCFGECGHFMSRQKVEGRQNIDEALYRIQEFHDQCHSTASPRSRQGKKYIHRSQHFK